MSDPHDAGRLVVTPRLGDGAVEQHLARTARQAHGRDDVDPRRSLDVELEPRSTKRTSSMRPADARTAPSSGS
ncbi:MAG: hypothetical protein IPJ61_14000 [Tessaracoccus sp.]|uniref:hypothetical protein n=1 Tax=Tessaracoccus sp. TaxID=1971211 RepID=UPI001ED5FD58|nr:hypothetical protein [Tessaracoccus sp.]MBK7822136.1 hypothetical protein [Tessaracoccus sp.]